MNAIGKIGVFLTFVGFLGVGTASIYAANASPVSVQEVVQMAKNVGTAEGIGWIVAGIGLAMAFSGLFMDLHDLRLAQTVSEFVCSDCGGSISENNKACPHCGAPIAEAPGYYQCDSGEQEAVE